MAAKTETKDNRTNAEKIQDRLDGFAWSVDYWVRQYAELKAKFLENAAKNPCYAISWGREMANAQGKYEVIYELLEPTGDIRETVRKDITIGELNELKYRLTEKSRRAHGQSTSMLSNGVEYEQWVAACSVLEELESHLTAIEQLGGQALLDADALIRNAEGS